MDINLESENLALRANPDVRHDDAAEMYSCYGAHISTDDHGDICVQKVKWEWMDDDKDADTFRAERLEELGAKISDEQRDAIEEIATHTDDYAVMMTRWESLRSRSGPLEWDTCESLVEMARRIRGDMEPIAELLDQAVDAATDGDLTACIEALQEASELETEHGDDPSTSALADQLLEDEDD